MATQNVNNKLPIPLGPVRIRVGSEHHRCMADVPVTLVPVSDTGAGYPWWIAPDSIDGIELQPGTAYVLDVVVTARPTPGRSLAESLEYRLVEIVETETVGQSPTPDTAAA